MKQSCEATKTPKDRRPNDRGNQDKGEDGSGDKDKATNVVIHFSMFVIQILELKAKPQVSGTSCLCLCVSCLRRAMLIYSSYLTVSYL